MGLFSADRENMLNEYLMCRRTLNFALQCSLCNYVDVKYVPTLGRLQEVIILNKFHI